MSVSNLIVTEQLRFEDAVINAEYRSHLPYASTSLGNSDEIRIPVQYQDLYTLPSQSYLYIEGKVLDDNNAAVANARLVNNAIAHLFEEIRYELNGIVIDRVRNPG